MLIKVSAQFKVWQSVEIAVISAMSYVSYTSLFVDASTSHNVVGV